MARDDERPNRKRRVVWQAVLLCVLATALAVRVLPALGTSGPPRPEISSVRLPENPTSETSARFMYTDAQPVSFECALDGSRFAACGSNYFGSRSYAGPLSAGSHTFRVRAVSGSKTSSAASYTWAIRTSLAVEQIATTRAASVEISGSVGELAPGVTGVISVTFKNPNTVPIHVTDLTVEIAADSTPSGCSSASNIILRQATGITSGTPVTVPAGSSVTVTTYPRAPEISFPNLSVNQDVCKDKSFTLTYTGSAQS
jgi:hypothetical protein